MMEAADAMAAFTATTAAEVYGPPLPPGWGQQADPVQPFKSPDDLKKAMEEQAKISGADKVIDLGDGRFALDLGDGTVSIGGLGPDGSQVGGAPKPMTAVMQVKFDQKAQETAVAAKTAAQDAKMFSGAAGGGAKGRSDAAGGAQDTAPAASDAGSDAPAAGGGFADGQDAWQSVASISSSGGGGPETAGAEQSGLDGEVRYLSGAELRKVQEEAGITYRVNQEAFRKASAVGAEVDGAFSGERDAESGPQAPSRTVVTPNK